MVKDDLAKVGQIGAVIRKCINLVSFVRKSTVAADVLQQENRLQANNATRQLKMIRPVSFVNTREQELDELDDAPKLTSHDRNILHDIIGMLAPFEEATDFVQVSCIPSAGSVMPCIRGLSTQLPFLI